MASKFTRTTPAVRSLKGIISTNDDPSLCAACSKQLHFDRQRKTISTIMFCCGKMICRRCCDGDKYLSRDEKHCSFCKSCVGALIGKLKKNAKRGKPWAQYNLGACHKGGKCRISQSGFESLRWFRKAAKQGHPSATLALAECCISGIGCAVDLAEAQNHVESAMALNDANILSDCHNKLYHIAAIYTSVRTDEAREEAIAILKPLAEDGVGEAQYRLGQILIGKKDHESCLSAYYWFSLASITMKGHADSAYFAAQICYNEVGFFAQSKFWLGIAMKYQEKLHPSRKEDRLSALRRSQKNFREMRDNCGGCGTVLQGKLRRMCKSCRVFCYCSRECQKMHWSRKEGGHAEDCKCMMELKEKMRTAQSNKQKGQNEY